MKIRLGLALGILLSLILLLAALAACGNQPEIDLTPAPVDSSALTPVAAALTTESGAVQPTPTVAPTPTPPPGAPKVVSIEPARGAELPPNQPIIIAFDRALDPESVKVAFEPAFDGQVTVDGAQVQFQPAVFVPGQSYKMQLSASANGFDTGELRFDVLAQGNLEVANTTPADSNETVRTDAPITIAFNRPIVPLGAASDDASLPQPLTLDPPAKGHGQWLNTSIYMFQPELPLKGGTKYIATVAGVTAISGSTLAEPFSFSFTTDRPVVVEAFPTGNLAPPTTPITITFSQPIDLASATTSTSVTGEKAGPLKGKFTLTADRKTLTFKPARNLPLGERVTVQVKATARAFESKAGLRREHKHTFQVVPYPAVLRTNPPNGAKSASLEEAVQFVFNAPIVADTLKLSISPAISATQVYSWYSEYDYSFNVFFPRKALTSYTLTLAGGVKDPYGNTIKEPTVLRFRTGEMLPVFNMIAPSAIGTYSAYTNTAVIFSHVNIGEIVASLYQLTPDQFATIKPNDDYDRWRQYSPPEQQLVRRWTIKPDGPRNEWQISHEALVNENNEPLGPGLYFLTAYSPQINYDQYAMHPRTLLVVTRFNTVIKRGKEDALVWVTDLADGQPAPNQQVVLYPFGSAPVSGRTDADGVFRAPVLASPEPWRSTDAFVGTAEDPGWASTIWGDGITPWNFDLPSDYYQQNYRIHVYTDRPLYRAGDSIHFRGVIRTDAGAIYDLPAQTPALKVKVVARNPMGDIIYSADLPIDAYGAIAADINLSNEAELGIYGIEVQAEPNFTAWTNFTVAAFRKPEFELHADVNPAEVKASQPTTATVQALYFFGGAVKNAAVHWTLYSDVYNFTYTEDGEYWSFNDFRPDAFYNPIPARYRQMIGEGDGKTDDQGQFSLAAPTELNIKDNAGQPTSELRTIEFSVTDANDQVVSGNTQLIVHAGGVYAGARPESYVGVVGEGQTVSLIAVDALRREPKPSQKLEVSVNLVAWRTVREKDKEGRTRYVTKVDETEVAKGEVTTDRKGRAQFEWTPNDPGEHLIRVTARDEMGNANRSAAFTWISGEEYAPWRVDNNDRIDLVVDKDQYKVGDTAKILIPSPFQGETTALITIERAGILSHELRKLVTNSETIEIPILAEYAPNVFVSVVLVSPPAEGESPTFKLGYAQLKVDPEQHLLKIEISAKPDPALPGDTVAYQIRATDWEGKPVQAQLSLALVDRALLSLMPVSGPRIDQTFWGERGLGVFTGVSLVASLNRVQEAYAKSTKGGGGGGAGDMAAIDVRSDFRDIAFWKADVETDAGGKAAVEVSLPDNLTTWQMRAVGASADTIAGEATHDLLVTKPLFIRPVLPRFVVHNDQFTMGAIVQNNTGQDQKIDLAIELVGLTAQGKTSYRLEAPNGELVRIDLPVLVDDIDPTSHLVRDDVIVRMTAIGGKYTDAIEIQLPVRRYSSPETVATAGVVLPDQPWYEAISLPKRYDPTQGDLTLRLEPSLAAGMVAGLDYLKHYPYECTEQTVSRFLPNVLTSRALAALGLEDPALKANLNQQVSIGLQRLYARQNADGGWGWFAHEKSSPYTSGYVLFGLAQAKLAGYPVDKGVMERGGAFLGRLLAAPDKLSGYKLNQQAFFVYVLDLSAQTAESDRPLAEAQLLFAEHDRLAVYAQAYLALTLQAQSQEADTGDQAAEMLDLISGKAILSATGAHWEESSPDYWTMNTNTRSTSVVLAALASIAPDHALGPNVVRWLMSARTADRWETTHETAWALIALTDWMVATGELQGQYDWNVAINDQPLGSGSVTPETVDEPQTLRVAIGDLLADHINTLLLQRSEGPGQLYYSAYLRTFLPVADLQAISRGVTVARRYTLHEAEPESAAAADIAEANIGDIIDVELTIVAPTTMHYLLVEDPIPAGTEPIDPQLATTSLGAAGPDVEAVSQPIDCWWCWLPTSYELKDDRVAMFATELTPGTYVFRYQLRASVAGQFNVLPPRAEMMYFPEVFGHGAGSQFTVTKP